MYTTSLAEIRRVLGFTERRVELINGLERYISAWTGHAYLDYVIIDGSFTTAKPEPGDIDMILVPIPAALSSRSFGEMARVLCYDRAFTKEEFGCEAFFVVSEIDLNEWTNFFSYDRMGNSRGLLQLRLPR